MDKKGTGKGKDCHMQWHNQAFFGLCFEDRKKIGIKTADWKQWTEEEYLKNSEKWQSSLKDYVPECKGTEEGAGEGQGEQERGGEHEQYNEEKEEISCEV